MLIKIDFEENDVKMGLKKFLQNIHLLTFYISIYSENYYFSYLIHELLTTKSVIFDSMEYMDIFNKIINTFQ